MSDNQEEMDNMEGPSEFSLPPSPMSIYTVSDLTNDSEDSDSISDFPESLLEYRTSRIDSASPIENAFNASQDEDAILAEADTESVQSADFRVVEEKPSLLCNVRFDMAYAINSERITLLNFETQTNKSPQFLQISLPMIEVKKIANNLIKLSRYLKPPNFEDLQCLNCHYVPTLPVTGRCGHTRCTGCILVNQICPCGAKAPEDLFVNVVIREITDRIKRIRMPRRNYPGLYSRTHQDGDNRLLGGKVRCLARRGARSIRAIMTPNLATNNFSRPRMPLRTEVRYRRAQQLILDGEYLEAATHFARVATSSEPYAPVARRLLTQTISAMGQGGSLIEISRTLRRSVREQSICNWLKPSDLECVLCKNTYNNPVSLPCGHTYCRSCIERSLCYQKRCALCLKSLETFNLAETADTLFLSSILSSIDDSPVPEEINTVPVLTCNVAFPGIPFPLIVINPRYSVMIRRVLQSGSRKIGMLAFEEGHVLANYGTILEVCDCVMLEDGRCIISTLGISRFKIIERYRKDGYDLASILPLVDAPLAMEDIEELTDLGVQIYCKAIEWLHSMDADLCYKIRTEFGNLPFDEGDGSVTNGPYWIWWLIAVLPLKIDVKVLILKSRSIIKRMLAVSRTLNAININVIPNPLALEPLNDLINEEQP